MQKNPKNKIFPEIDEECCTVGVYRSRFWYFRFWLSNLINPDEHFNKISTLPNNEVARRIVMLYHLHGDRLDKEFLEKELESIKDKLGIKQFKQDIL